MAKFKGTEVDFDTKKSFFIKRIDDHSVVEDFIRVSNIGDNPGSP